MKRIGTELVRGVLQLIVIAPTLVFAGLANAGDGTPVTNVTTVRTPAVPSGPYNIAGETVRYGVGDNVQITGANVGGLSLTRSAVSKPAITINRIDNANVQGERLTFFYPGVVSGSNVNIEGDEAPTMEIAMNDDYITSGGLDVFLNVDAGVERANNIERIDFVVRNGINLPSTAALVNEVGTIANEKHGNNTYKIAMITSIDAFGRPTSFGGLRTVEGRTDYGSIGRPRNGAGTQLRNLYMRNAATPSGGSNGTAEYIQSDTNFIGLSYVSFGALGAVPNQTVYGYSLFANDMTNSHDLVGLTDAPLNTSGGSNGGDIYGGTFAIFASPAAEAETSEGGEPELKGSKTVAIFDEHSVGLYAVPGNDVVYTISISNQGDGSPDENSVVIIDALPADVEFYHGDVDGDSGPETNPVSFADHGSGLNFSYVDDVRYANSTGRPADFSACTHTPAAGYVDTVTHICVRPSGTMAYGVPSASFDVSFRARIK